MIDFSPQKGHFCPSNAYPQVDRHVKIDIYMPIQTYQLRIRVFPDEFWTYCPDERKLDR